MSKTAFILGGTGQIGRAAAALLADTGWRVTVASRGSIPLPRSLTSRGVRQVIVDRTQCDDLSGIIGRSVDVLIDTIAYTAADAEQLIRASHLIGSIVVISSASVYVDSEGRSLDEAKTDDDFPDFDGPIQENQPTVAPGDLTYSASKIDMEQTLLAHDPVPATVIRPCAIHGPGSQHAREWYFVKRALDRRPFVVLAYRGASIFHTTSVTNLAELIRLAAEYPGTRIFNCGDPTPPTVLEISRLIAEAVGHEFAEVLIPGDIPGRTPWSVVRPMVVDMSKAERQLGYRSVASYASAVRATCDWLRAEVTDANWHEVLPRLAAYPMDLFDYASEDAVLSQLANPAV